MPLFTSLLTPSSAGNLVADKRIITVNQGTHDGCPLLTAGRSAVMLAGHDGILEWELRDVSGYSLDLTSLTVPCSDTTLGKVVVRFGDIFREPPCVLATVDPATIYDPTTGTVRVGIPTIIRNSPGIYIVEFSAYDCAGTLLAMDSGLLSVERSLTALGAVANAGGCGPLTLREVRTQMRDILEANDLANEYEYTDQELVHSIVQPIRYWNEMPPDVARFTAYTFPYCHHWLKGTCANLLRIAAAWYRRTKYVTPAGGVTLGGERDKDRIYLEAALELDTDWKQFVARKKVEINVSQMYGSV